MKPGNFLHRIRFARPTGISVRDVFSKKAIFGWPPPDATRDTAWLDGLRGVAAFLVMSFHFNLTLYARILEPPFGAQAEVDGEIVGFWEFWRLPFIRLLMCSGHAQVSVFFVLSGFVLSWGPLESIRNGKTENFARSLGSATFRRWLRLFLPCFAVSFWSCLSFWFGLRTIYGKEPKDHLYAQIWDWIVDSEKFADPFHINRHPFDQRHQYDWIMWTIPLEWAGSLLVFLTLLAVGRIHNFYKRIFVTGGIATYAMFKHEWHFWLFASGMALADYVHQRGGFETMTNATTTTSRAAWSAVLVAALYLMGVPEASNDYTIPGYEWTKALTPASWKDEEAGTRFWWCWAGLMFIVAACHLRVVRSVFAWPFMRYLGRVSFMLYLTHRTVENIVASQLGLRTLLYRIFGRGFYVSQPSDSQSPFVHALATFMIWILHSVITMGVAVMVGNWLEVLFDAPSTRLARHVDAWFSDAPPPKHKAVSSTSADRALPLYATETALEEEQASLLHRHTEMTELRSEPESLTEEARHAGHTTH